MVSGNRSFSVQKIVEFKMKCNGQSDYVDIFHSIRVLFTFDNDFYKTFDGEDGKSAEEHMEEVLKHVKYAYQDNTFQREIGTTVNIIANKTTYDGSL